MLMILSIATMIRLFIVIFARSLKPGPTPVCADNETSIAWSEGSIGGSERAKHLDLRVHYLHEAVKAGEIVLRKVDTKLNCSDLLTKSSVPAERFAHFRRRLMGL